MILRIVRTTLTSVGAAVVAGGIIQTIHGRRLAAADKAPRVEHKTQMNMQDSLPGEVWSPDIVGDYFKHFVDDMVLAGENDGVLFDWATVEVHTHEDFETGRVILHGSVDVIGDVPAGLIE